MALGRSVARALRDERRLGRAAIAANWRPSSIWRPVAGGSGKGTQLGHMLAARTGQGRGLHRIPPHARPSAAASARRTASPTALFSGDLSRAEKDAAIARFRDQARVLLSTGAGGEGRNLQFADTVINFDLPWNPMRIEQRIGRVHRIGQDADVFVFNFCQARHRGRAAAARAARQDQHVRAGGGRDGRHPGHAGRSAATSRKS